jgi:putative toxin-antitoxin system antitoxin component (TIGR02293 family)
MTPSRVRDNINWFRDEPSGGGPVRSPVDVEEEAVRLLGGSRKLRYSENDPFAAHNLIKRGMPFLALLHLLRGGRMKTRDLLRVLGMTERTLQRRKTAPEKRLTANQSGKAWKYAEILAKATTVFGSRDRAEEWLERPAIGLDRERPIDLLETPAGMEKVETLLERLEYGAYT